MDVKLGQAADAALDRIEREQSIGEELLLWISNGLSNLFSGESVPDGDLSSFEQLARQVKAQRAYGKMVDEQLLPIFDMGAIWGMSGLYDMWRDAAKLNEDALARRLELRNHESLFDIVQANPGITHKALASRYGKTPSRLTQIVYRLMQLRLLSASKHGRTKHYYLTTDAERMRDKMREAMQIPTKLPTEMPSDYTFVARKTEVWEFFRVRNEVTSVAAKLESAGTKGRMPQLQDGDAGTAGVKGFDYLSMVWTSKPVVLRTMTNRQTNRENTTEKWR